MIRSFFAKYNCVLWLVHAAVWNTSHLHVHLIDVRMMSSLCKGCSFLLCLFLAHVFSRGYMKWSYNAVTFYIWNINVLQPETYLYRKHTLPSFWNNAVQYDEFAHKNTNAAKPLPFVGNVLLGSILSFPCQ